MINFLIKRNIHQQIKQVGRKCFLAGLNNSHSGNISIKKNNYIYITRTGSSLDQLKISDIIRTELNVNKVADRYASIELIVHRAIYKANPDINSITHAHAPYAIAMADKGRDLIPYDDEGKYYLGSIPVLSIENTIASKNIADQIRSYVHNSHSIIIAKHGVFAWGPSLDDAYKFLSVTESACKINYLTIAGTN
ncbi:MAG: aldolase [bacterium]|nr:aldolase [bacterium]